MSYLTHGHRRPKRSVTVAHTLTAILVVFGPWIVVGYLVWRWVA